MDEVLQKYPLADSAKVRKLWEGYQFSNQSLYTGFLDYYERHPL